MRKILYVLILGLLFFAPVERLDVAKLLPIRAVAIYVDGDEVVLETDTGHKGRGADALQALGQLKENTPAVVYLDTAEYLLVADGAQTNVDPLRSVLKSGMKVAVWDGTTTVEEAAQYLDVHGGVTELRHWQTK